MAGSTTFNRALRHDRLVVAAALALVVILSWAYLLAGAGIDMDHPGMSMSEAMAMPWSPSLAALMLVMWAVMMVAMMLPSAAPVVLLFDTIARRRRERGEVVAATGFFVLGYVTVWTAFSVAATGLQYALEQFFLLSMEMRTTSRTLAGGLLVAAGLYQFTPWKLSCLRQCQSPLDFVLGHWREGRRGALGMGWRHGLYCLGCCWLLMLLLFVGGLMNLVWIAALAAFVAVEKFAGERVWVTRAGGLVLIVWGFAASGLLPTGVGFP